jgi:murein DD-endopeptidase MepM/ murein hydrolase activator NlpD
MPEENITKMVAVACVIMALLVSFQLGIYTYQLAVENGSVVNPEAEQLRLQVNELQRQIATKEDELASLQLETDNYAEREEELMEDINGLRSRIAGISTRYFRDAENSETLGSSNSSEDRDQDSRHPFQVPTTGVVGSSSGGFRGNMYGMTHLGIDIWTSQANGGRIASGKGNPVYSACDGKVVNKRAPNADITIKCDEIPSRYDVPEHSVYTHYAHLGNAESKELYILVNRNDRVEKGQLVGYQGNLSSFFPEMRNVHLHFSVFTGISETDPNGGAINPCYYIGGNCQRQGEIFTVR